MQLRSTALAFPLSVHFVALTSAATDPASSDKKVRVMELSPRALVKPRLLESTLAGPGGQLESTMYRYRNLRREVTP